MDADLFETLVQDFNCGANSEFEQGRCASPDQLQSAGPQPSDPVPPPPVHPEHGNSVSDGASQLTIDHFPHGSPGAPIAGADQGPHVYQSSQDMFGPSSWAPFHSQRDWEIARWAKMRGPTSSALADLLAIPEVRVPLLIVYIMLLTLIGRSSTISDCHIARRRN
jgi:hypothetical protein